MTTLVTTRRPLQLISMSNQPQRRTSKRLAGRWTHDDDHDARGARRADIFTAVADYERDDDFQFVRKSKRVKTDKAEEPEPVKKAGRGSRTTAKQRAAAKGSTTNGTIVEEETIVKETAPKEKEAKETTTAAKPATRKSTRRKPSVDASVEEPALKVPKRQTRRSARVSGEKLEEEPPQAKDPPQTNGASQKRARRPKSPRPPPDWDKSPEPRHAAPVESAKIALPMSDTPVINRNKEMRKKGGNSNRRSSLGMRGRRASSLIESGQTAIPHREVNTVDFYKHIEADGLTEPRRMKQLLTWCGERSLAPKPPHGTPNSNAILGGECPLGYLCFSRSR